MNRPKFLLYPLGFLVLSAGIVWAGQTTMTTYYPSPTGNYNTLTAQNIGIGTPVPGAKLDIVNADTSATITQDLKVRHTAQATLGSGTSIGLFAEGFELSRIEMDNDVSAQASLRFYTYNSSLGERMRITGAGNVGIGSTAPGANLEIYNTATAFEQGIRLTVQNYPDIYFNSYGGSGWGDIVLNRYAAGYSSGGSLVAALLLRSGNSVQLAPNDTVAMTLATSGNVGIGYTAPGAKLSFNNLNDGTNGADGITWYNPGPLSYGIYRTAGAWSSPNYQQLELAFSTGIIIDGGSAYGKSGTVLQPNGGNVRIGSNPLWFTSAWSGYANTTSAEISNDTGAYKTLMIVGNSSANGSTRSVSIWDLLTVNGNENVNGNILASGTITASSDKRLKQNIVPLTGTLSKLDQLRGVSFEWNHLSASMGHKEGEKNIGMIAQELQKVYPELVVASKNGHQEYLSIDYGKFTAVLLQSVKELKSQMNTMQDQINILQEKVKILEKQK